jgi:hypothetical protein
VKPNTIRKFHQNPKMLLMKKQNIGPHRWWMLLDEDFVVVFTLV